MKQLIDLLNRGPRTVAGLMSGTSLDGIDTVIARLDGTGREMRIEQLGAHYEPYPEALRRALLANSAEDTSSVKDLSQLSARLGYLYAEAVRECCRVADVTLRALDAVGCHGQTVHHVPQPEESWGRAVRSTMQIGDPAVISAELGLPVVDHFRAPDMAAGGQGAPLVPYFDFVYFTSDDESRGLLNLGGIANLTVLPRSARPEDVIAFDTGPANMVIDGLAERFLGTRFDENGRVAATGTASNDLLEHLLADPYLAASPPKSTGRERYTAAFIEDLLGRAQQLELSVPDILATATEYTACTVWESYKRLNLREPVEVIIASGGGTHNDYLMQRLRAHFDPVPVKTATNMGVDADFKEALCFAVLAHEFLNGTPTNLPSATGATRPMLLGRLSVPYQSNE